MNHDTMPHKAKSALASLASLVPTKEEPMFNSSFLAAKGENPECTGRIINQIVRVHTLHYVTRHDGESFHMHAVIQPI